MDKMGDKMNKMARSAGVATRILRSDGPWTPLGRIRLAAVSPQATGVHEWPFRFYDAYAFVYILGGRGSYRDTSGISSPIARGDAILVFPAHPHWYGPERGTRWSELFVVFEGPAFDLWRQTGVISSAQPLLQLPDPKDCERPLIHLLESGRPRSDREALIDIVRFVELLTRAVAVGSPGRGAGLDAMEWAQALLQSELGRQLDASEVAAQIGLSYETFRKRFREATGTTPKRFRDAARIAAAKELLRTTSMSNRDLATALGYADGFHFSRRFRDATGEPPQSFRRSTTPAPPASTSR